MHGPPTVESFAGVDAAVAERAKSIEVDADAALLESEFVLSGGGAELVRVTAALGSPQQPMDAAALRAKVERPWRARSWRMPWTSSTGRRAICSRSPGSPESARPGRPRGSPFVA